MSRPDAPMAKTWIAVPGFAPRGAESLAVAAGGLVFTSACAAATAAQAVRELEPVLRALGADVAQVGKAKAFLRDPEGGAAAAADLRALLPGAARTLVGSDMPAGHLAIELVAGLQGGPVRFEGGAGAPGATQLGALLFTDGCGAFDAGGFLRGAGDLSAQARAALAAVCAALAQGGTDPSRLLKVNNTAACWHEYRRYNEVYAAMLEGSNAARCSVGGRLRHPLSLIEVEAVAAMPGADLRFVDSTRSGVGRPVFAQRPDTDYRADLGPCKGPHSHGARAGDVVFIAGECPYDADDRLIGAGDVAAQTLRTLDNVRIGLAALGAGLDDVVKTSVTLADIRLAPAFEAAYRSVFAPPYPARSLVATPLGQYGILVEIEAVAVIGARRSAIAAVATGEP